MKKVIYILKKKSKEQSGFTLIEILIVVILLGILATVIIPQISVSSDDAKLNSLKTNLSNLRSALELYYFQHGNRFPGQYKEADGTTATGTDGEAATAYVAQLTKYSDSNGKVNNSGTTEYSLGPYLRNGVPTNPYNSLATVVCDYDETDITVKTSSGQSAAWKFYPKTGVLVSGDNGAHDTL